MGVLDLLCVTTDPDATTFYGFAYAEDYSSTDVKPQYAVLVKSNTNPSSPSDLAWSIVSKIDGSKLKGYPGSVNGVDTSCSITARGVFTMVGQYKATSSPIDIMAHFGIRYDPTALMDTRIKFDGPGAWMNINIVNGYHYSGDFTRYSLGYISNGALVHVSLSDTNNTITLATVNETTLTLAPTAVWTMNPDLNGKSVQALTIGNDYLFTFGYGATGMVRPFLAGFPLTLITPVTPFGTVYNTSVLMTPSYSLHACYSSPTPFLYVNHRSLTLVCAEERGMYSTSALYTITDPTSSYVLGPAVEFDADVIKMEYFVPIGPGFGASTFALIRKYGTMYAFGNDGGFRYTHLIEKVSVAESLRSNPYPAPLPRPSLDSSLPLSTGIVVGIVAGVVVVLAGIAFLLVRRYRIRRSKGNKATLSAGDKDQSGSAKDDNSSISSKKLSDNGGPKSFYLEGKYLDSSDSEKRTTSTDILPMAPITPIPENLQKQMEELQEKMRAVQEQIQATQFSSHPGPSVVSTVSYDSVPATSNTTEPHTGTTTTSKPPWRPTPSVSSAGSSESMDLCLPCAPAYSSIIAQPSLQDAPDLWPRESVRSIDEVVTTPIPPSAGDSIQCTNQP